MTYKDRTNRVELGIDQAIVFLFSLFTHDAFHDMYYSHGTGKLRALKFFHGKTGILPNASAAGKWVMDATGGSYPGDHDDGEYPDEDEDAKGIDIKLALKMGMVTLPTMADKIFLNINSRSGPRVCATDVQYCIYIDVYQIGATIFTPGWVIIDDEILSPFDLEQIESMNIDTSTQGVASFRVINGQNIGLIMNILKNTSGEFAYSIQVIPPPRETGEPVEGVFLNQLQVFQACVNPETTYRIKQIIDKENDIYDSQNKGETFEQYIIDDRLGQVDNPGDAMPDPTAVAGVARTDYTARELDDALNSVYYYLCVHTSLLNIQIILTDIAGENPFAYLFNEMLKTPDIFEKKAPQIPVDFEELRHELQFLVNNINVITIESRTAYEQPLFIGNTATGGPQPMTNINTLANFNLYFYPDFMTADRGFLITLSKMCVIYDDRFHDKVVCGDYRNQLLKLRPSIRTTAPGFDGSLLDQFLFVLSDYVLFKQLEIDIIDEDEEQMNLLEYITSLGEFTPQQNIQWEDHVRKAMRALPPETLYNNLMQMNTTQQQRLIGLLTPEEQGQQKQLNALHTQQQMLNDEQLDRLSTMFNQAVSSNNTYSALNIIESMTPIQIVQLRRRYRTRHDIRFLNHVVNALQQTDPIKFNAVKQLTSPQEMSGGYGTPVNTLYEITNIVYVSVALSNAFLDIKGEEVTRRVRGSSGRINPLIQQEMNNTFAPLMKGALGKHILDHVSKTNYLAVVGLHEKRVNGTRSGYLELFPPPPSLLAIQPLPGYNDKEKEKIRKIKRNLLSFDSEGFGTLVNSFPDADGRWDPVKMLNDTILNDEYIAFPLRYSGKRSSIYKKLESIFDNISTMMSFLAIIIKLNLDKNTAPPPGGTYDYYFSQVGDFTGPNGYLTIIRQYFMMAEPLFQFITQLTGKKLPFNALGRLNNGYVLGTVAAIMTHCLENAPDTGKTKMLFSEEKRMIENLLTKGASGKYDKLLNNQAPPNDTKLVTSIINLFDFYERAGNAQLITKWPATAGAGVNVSLFTDLAANGWGGVLKTMIPGQPGSDQRYFVNNAVSMSVDRLDVSQRHYCPTPSIIDAMTTICANLKKSLESGVEWGVMDFMVQCPLPDDGGNLFTYRVRVEPALKNFNNSRGVPSFVNISAYFQIKVFEKDRQTSRDIVLINVRKGDIVPADSWPGTTDRSYHDGFEVNLASNDSGPLSASASVENLQYFIDAIPFSVGYTDTYENLIRTLHIENGETVIATFSGESYTTPNRDNLKISAKFKQQGFFPDGPYTVDELRRGIIEHSFRKSLGDYLQEMTTIVANGGYIISNFGGITLNPPPQYSAGLQIRLPNAGRLGLHNDRPAAARAILLTLFARGDVNPNTLSGLVVTDKENRLNYVIAGRGVNDQDYQEWQTAQEGGKKQKKTRRKKRKERKSKRKVIKKQRKSIHRKRKKRKSKNTRRKH